LRKILFDDHDMRQFGNPEWPNINHGWVDFEDLGSIIFSPLHWISPLQPNVVMNF